MSGVVHDFSNPAELADILLQNNLLSYIENFTEDWFYEYLENFIRSPSAEVMANRLGDVSSVKLKFGRKTRWIILSSSWGEHANINFLRRLDRLFQYADVGYHPTPGSLGSAVLRKTWREGKLGFHTSPGAAACDYIYQHQTGGRVDTPGLFRYYDEGIDYDEASGYLAKNIINPTSTAIRYERNPSDRYYTWFGKCNVRIKSELALGPFPIRLDDGRVVYPTLPGKYETYVWRREYERMIEAGCDVDMDGGYGWLECTMDTLSWCQHMYQLKTNADEDWLEDYVKNTIVALIGRYGMKDEFRVVVHQDEADEMDEPIVTRDGLPTEWCIHLEKNKTAIPMPHWFNHTIREVAVDTYEFALPFAERGELIATNYDSVLVVDTTVVPNTVRKHHSIACEPGTWRWQFLTDFYIPAPRAIVSSKKTRLPGTRRDIVSTV